MKYYTIYGKVEKVFDLKEGTTDSGFDWQSQDILISLDNPNETEICFTTKMKDTKFLVNIKKNDHVEIEFFLSSREHDKKWYASHIATWVVKCPDPKQEDSLDKSDTKKIEKTVAEKTVKS